MTTHDQIPQLDDDGPVTVTGMAAKVAAETAERRAQDRAGRLAARTRTARKDALEMARSFVLSQREAPRLALGVAQQLASWVLAAGGETDADVLDRRLRAVCLYFDACTLTRGRRGLDGHDVGEFLAGVQTYLDYLDTGQIPAADTSREAVSGPGRGPVIPPPASSGLPARLADAAGAPEPEIDPRHAFLREALIRHGADGATVQELWGELLCSNLPGSRSTSREPVYHWLRQDREAGLVRREPADFGVGRPAHRWYWTAAEQPAIRKLTRAEWAHRLDRAGLAGVQVQDVLHYRDRALVRGTAIMPFTTSPGRVRQALMRFLGVPALGLVQFEYAQNGEFLLDVTGARP